MQLCDTVIRIKKKRLSTTFGADKAVVCFGEDVDEVSE